MSHKSYRRVDIYCRNYGNLVKLHERDDLCNYRESGSAIVQQVGKYLLTNHIMKHFCDIHNGVKAWDSVFAISPEDLIKLYDDPNSKVENIPHKSQDDFFWKILDIKASNLKPNDIARPGIDWMRKTKIRYICLKCVNELKGTDYLTVVAIFPNMTLNKII